MNTLLLLAALALAGDRVQLSTGTAVVTRPEGRYLIKGPADIKFSKDQVRISLGGLLASLRRPMKIRTQAVVAAVRGTELYVEGDYVCLCKGAVELSDADKKAVPHPVTSTTHTGTRLIDGKWRAQEKMHGHTDAELALLKAP
jgi:hypothetical protein